MKDTLESLQKRLDLATDLLIECRPDISEKHLADRVDEWLGVKPGLDLPVRSLSAIMRALASTYGLPITDLTVRAVRIEDMTGMPDKKWDSNV